jgi:tetratricopeptide (TPR) repeat protein
MGFIERLLALLKMGANPEHLTRKASALAAKEEYLAAVEKFKKALELDPLYVPAFDGLGRAYFRLGFREESEREFAIADGLERLAEDPHDLEAAVKLGRALMNKGHYKLVITTLAPAFEKYSKHPELLKIFGVSYRNLGQDKKARELFQAGIQRAPRDPDFYVHLAGIENKLGKKDEAERLSETAKLMTQVDSDPGNVAARYNLGRLFFMRGLYNEAADYLRQAVSIDKLNPDNWLFLGQCYQKASLYPASADAFKQACKLAPSDPRPQKALAQIYQLMSRFDESKAAKQVAMILEEGQGETRSPQQAAKFLKYLLSIGLSDEAKKHLDEMLAIWPDNMDLQMILGRFMVKENRFQEAVDILGMVAMERENWAEAHIWLAVAYQRLGDTMSALAEGQLATRLAPKSHVIHKIFGDILREQKKFSMAENAYETAEHLKSGKARK